jgi:hypothetical protein
MEESSQNENRMNNNDVVMEEEIMEEEYEIYPSLQIEESINAYEKKEKMEEIWKNQRKKWR